MKSWVSSRERVLTVTEADFAPGLVGLRGEVALNKFYYSSSYEADIIVTTASGYFHEFEFKNNRDDFKLDFMKCAGRMARVDGVCDPATRRTRQPNDGRVYKHDLIKRGDFGLRSFSFICPHYVIDPAEVPEYCGLVWMDKDLFGNVFADVMIPAPNLPNFKRRRLQK